MIRLVSDTIDVVDMSALCNWLLQDPKTVPRLTKGELTLELEAKWAEMVGTKHSVFVNSGSSAILLVMAALKTQGIGPSIVIPALSWGTDLSIPALLNYKPILCDCNLEDLSVDLEHLEEIFELDGPKILLLVSVLGLVPQMDKIVELCKRYNVMLIEDCCESMGSKFQGNNLGTFGFASIFSTFFGHHISTIEGGFINTDDEEFYHRLLMMRSHGWARDLPQNYQDMMRNIHNVNKFNEQYTFYVPGMNLRSTDLQAFIGLRSIKKLDTFSRWRWDNFKIMKDEFADINKLNLPIRDGDFISNFAFPLVVVDEREEMILRFKHKVEIRPIIAGNLANQPIWKAFGGNKTNTPNASLIDKHGMYIPNHQDIYRNDITTMSELAHENSKAILR